MRLALLFAVGGCSPEPLGPAALSLLAVGDTGAPPSEVEDYRHLLDVSAAMAAEHRERPVAALVLLGDNFYPAGLRSRSVVPQVRATLVRPFCVFLALSAPRSGEVADACATPERERRPVPLFAVLGNHDYEASESPALQRAAIPRFVSNWQLGAPLAEVHELGSGVSLITFDSERLVAGEDPAPLRDALGASRGPWRILAAHRPALVLREPAPGATVEARRQLAEHRAYVERTLRAIESSGVAVHLLVAGHEHNLQILAGAPPAPPLQIVAGGGSDPRSIRGELAERRGGWKSLGFARVDLIQKAGSARLVASLYRVPDSIERLLGDRRLAARWSVDAAGRLRAE